MTVAGIEPRTVASPRSIEELSSVVAALYDAGNAFAFVGGGGDLELGNAPRALHTVVQTGGIAGVVDYAPEDQTITVGAGMTIAAVSAALAEHAQFLAVDVAEPERTTVGGAIAANLFGRRRLRYGSIKDNIVGIEIVRPDGTRARGGGKVVKNVAGFDIPKLMVGSLGTLGAVATATFRVHPIEKRRAAVAFRGLRGEAVLALGEALLADGFVPASVTAYDAADRHDVVVAFEGFPRGVDEQVAAAPGLAARLGMSADVLDDGEALAFEERERRVRRAGAWRISIGTAPQRLASVLAEPSMRTAQRVWYPLIGAGLLAGDEFDAATIARWRAAHPQAVIVVSAMPATARESVDAWGTPPPSLPIMRRLKEQFDPKGLCNPGRFVGGL